MFKFIKIVTIILLLIFIGNQLYYNYLGVSFRMEEAFDRNAEGKVFYDKLSSSRKDVFELLEKKITSNSRGIFLAELCKFELQTK